jgi:sterol 24-C-methyltransferase
MAPVAVDDQPLRQEKRINEYTKFWQKDVAKEGEVDTSNRLDSYSDVVNGMSQSDLFFLLL